MAPLVETFPETAAAINQKSDLTAVPVGQEDNWWSAADSNRVGQILALERAIRLLAGVAAVAPDTSGVNGKAFRFTGIDSVTGLGDISTSLATELNKLFAAAIEKIEQGGDLDGTASASGFMAVHAGLVTVASGTFTTGDQVALSSDGGLITFVSGNLPPIGTCINATTVYIDMSGRVRADGTTVKYNSSGQLEVLTTAGEYDDGGEARGKNRTLGNTDAFSLSFLTNNLSRLTITASGDVDVVSGDLQMAGTVLISSTRDVTLLDGSTIRFGAGVNMTIAGSGAQDGIVLTAQDAAGDSIKLVVNEDVIVTQRGFRRSVSAGLTASTTQTQGQQPLTEDINQVSTVANPSDVITLRTAREGGYQTIINDGANLLQIFPASGDDLGAGVDTSETLAAGESATYLAYDATNWQKISTTVGDNGGNQLESFEPNEAVYPASAPAAATSRNEHPLIAFDDSADENIIFQGMMSQDYKAGSLTVDLSWVAASATSGNVKWNVAFERIADGGHDIDADSFAAIQTGTSAANGTSGIVTKTSITFTQAQADAIAASDAFRLKVTRDADDAGDTMTGDAQLLRVQIRQ